MREKECSNDKDCENWKDNKWHHYHNGSLMAGGGGAVYGLGLIGAVIFFVGKATTFWMGVLGLLKAVIWPVLLVYEAFNFLIK